MKESLKYKPGILYFSTQLKSPEEAVYEAPGIKVITLKMTGSLKYTPGILYFISQLNFPVEDVF